MKEQPLKIDAYRDRSNIFNDHSDFNLNKLIVKDSITANSITKLASIFTFKAWEQSDVAF